MISSLCFIALKSLFIIFFILVLIGIMLFVEQAATRLFSRGHDNHSTVNPLLALLKLLSKEPPFIPRIPDHFLLKMTPALNFFFAFLPAIVIPWSDPFVFFGTSSQSEVFTTSFGILFFFAFSSLAILTVLWAGWLTQKEIPTLSAMRAAYREISCKVPLLMIVFSMILFYRSSDFQQIILIQEKTSWGLFKQPLAAFIFFIALMAEIGKPPFDTAENTFELNGAYLAEYTGTQRLFLFLAEHVNTLIFTVVFIHFFLGGYQPLFGFDRFVVSYPQSLFVIQGLSLFIKVAILIVLYTALKFSFARFRHNDLMFFGQNRLLPLSFLNLLVVIVGQYYKEFGRFF